MPALCLVLIATLLQLFVSAGADRALSPALFPASNEYPTHSEPASKPHSTCIEGATKLHPTSLPARDYHGPGVTMTDNHDTAKGVGAIGIRCEKCYVWQLAQRSSNPERERHLLCWRIGGELWEAQRTIRGDLRPPGRPDLLTGPV